MGQGVLINPWKTSGEDKVEEGEGRVERDTWRRLARLSRTDIATTQDGAPSAEGGAQSNSSFALAIQQHETAEFHSQSLKIVCKFWNGLLSNVNRRYSIISC